MEEGSPAEPAQRGAASSRPRRPAARLHGWSNALAARRGEQRGPAIREAHARLREALQAQYDAVELARLQADGAALDEDAVAALILGARAG